MTARRGASAWAGDAKTELPSGEYRSPANQTVQIGVVETPPEPSMLVVEWQDVDGAARNHYLAGTPPVYYKTVRNWYEALRVPRDQEGDA